MGKIAVRGWRESGESDGGDSVVMCWWVESFVLRRMD